MSLMFNLLSFKKIVIAALWTGLLAGLLLTVVQQIQVIPTLLQAEVYEEKAAAALLVSGGHLHEQQAWQPENGVERTFFTAVANISLAVGFALLMGAVISLRNGTNTWRTGLLWGLAGYVVFFLAPSLGLPPEVPGTETAQLQERQIWWLMTVFDTAFGLWLLVFAKTTTNKALGVLLLLSPHLLIKAPQPTVAYSAAPVELAHSFMLATTLANAIFWLAIGGLMGRFYKQDL